MTGTSFVLRFYQRMPGVYAYSRVHLALLVFKGMFAMQLGQCDVCKLRDQSLICCMVLNLVVLGSTNAVLLMVAIINIDGACREHVAVLRIDSVDMVTKLHLVIMSSMGLLH
jgi:hypothetical protein